MDAKDLPDLVVDYLYDELDPEQRTAFEAALPDAPDVRAEVEAFQRTRETFADLDELDVPSPISDKLMAEAARVAPAPQRRSLLERIRAGLSLLVLHPAISAAVVMVAVLGVSLYVYRHGAPPSRVPKADTPAMPAAAPLAVARADESAKKQEVQLQGEQRARQGKAAFAQQKAPRQAPAASVAKTDQARLGNRGLASGSLAKGGFKREGLFKRAGGKAGKADSMNNIYSDRRNKAAARALSLRARKRSASNDDKAAAPAPKRTAKKRAYRSPVRKPAARPAPNTKDLNEAVRLAKPKPRPKAKAKSKASKQKGAAEKPATAQRWLQLGSSAAASKRCPEAFDYFTRALKAKPSLLTRVSAQLGSCRAALRRAGAAHAWLRNRIHGQERRPARRKARRRRVLDQRIQEAK
jgi:hypothetical protein